MDVGDVAGVLRAVCVLGEQRGEVIGFGVVVEAVVGRRRVTPRPADALIQTRATPTDSALKIWAAPQPEDMGGTSTGTSTGRLMP